MLNILPIPVLDGHLLLLAIEAIRESRFHPPNGSPAASGLSLILLLMIVVIRTTFTTAPFPKSH